MIPAIHPRGTKVGGLLRYLFGPGKREEHTNPHLVAAWTDAGPLATLEPPTRADGKRDVRQLTDLLEQPVTGGRNPPRQTVWHCSIRTHPTDRTLSDNQWAHIAGEVMAAVGLAPHGDHRAVRWVAVRHADDHIHLVATLVRQDRRTAWAWKDKLRAQQACRELEERYGLYRVAPPGAGSRGWPRPAELNKTARLGRRAAPQELLRRQIRTTATTATGEADFFARLAAAGVEVKLRHSSRNPSQVTGYAVGLPDHTTAAGDSIWYGGGRLAADLSLPRLRARWASSPNRPTPRPRNAARIAADAFPPHPGLYRDTADAARSAAGQMNAATATDIAGAAADVLSAAAHAWESDRDGPLTAAAEALDRAAYEQQRPPRAPNVSYAGQLRSMARLISVMGAVSEDTDTTAALHLILNIAAIAEYLADIREAQQRLHQSQAARAAASLLSRYAPPARVGRSAPSTSRSYVRPDHYVAPTRSDRRAR
ncbi:relaxase/mobilization nuclease domain-containing protein [Phytohabitans kaempferiae]|uniref:Relaxase/mobilization nuclease domain-containing protein n=1 Tax=Phytohabitans kaempferiae TaxID=1620943 RepID=A0ABV6MDL0_9ACTN